LETQKKNLQRSSGFCPEYVNFPKCKRNCIWVYWILTYILNCVCLPTCSSNVLIYKSHDMMCEAGLQDNNNNSWV
jgi:hypothetical protein